MSETKKPSFWDRLLGRDARPSLDDEQNSAPDSPAPTEPEYNLGPDAAPPEMQAEWLKSDRADAPEPEPDTPETIWDPFDATPENLGAAPEPDPESAVPEAVADSAPAPLLVEDVAPGPEALSREPAQNAVASPETFPVPAQQAQEPEKKRSWFQRLSDGLKRSSDSLSSSIGAVFTKRRLDNATLDDLEDILIQSDLGVDTALAITARLRSEKFDKTISPEEVRAVLAEEVEAALAPVATPLVIDTAKKPFVILMVGVNGAGKTTTIGKLTAKYRAEGHSVLLAAGDTFRAAAVEQLQIWGQRTGTEVMTRPTGADAAGLAFDAISRARAENIDIVIIDTAGRLQNRTELMDELEKILRVIKKLDPDAPHASLLTLDATTGQNALNQVEIFGQKAGVTGLVMTKLDGTARGGILVAIARKFGLPIHFIGVGEAIGDLEPFAAGDFARAMVGQISDTE